jgi:hypothetical protein
MENDRRFLVFDEYGDMIRTFLSRREAKWFIHNKPGYTIKENPKENKQHIWFTDPQYEALF